MGECWPLLNQDVFNELHPFSFITDAQGVVKFVGRSFAALHGTAVIGRPFSDLGVTSRLAVDFEPNSPEQLVGEVFSFRLKGKPDVAFRGHVVRGVQEEACFIFALQPSILRIDEVSRLGLTIADFEVGTPLFDWLMALRAQENAQNQLAIANKQLLLDVQLSELLQKITTEAFCAEHSEQLFRRIIATICRDLEWDIGHVFFVATDLTEGLLDSDIWYLSDRERYERFIEHTRSSIWNDLNVFPAVAIHKESAIWISDYGRNGGSDRAALLPSHERPCAVAVAVRVGDRPVAVLEFISERPKTFSKSIAVFFSLLGTQLGLALAHHEAVEKERAQLVQLATASKMATLGELAAGVAHEIKNPLSTISLIVQILKRFGASGMSTPEGLQEQISRIDLCVERIASIVSKLNDFSRDSSNDPLMSVAVQKILADAQALSQARFAARGVSLVVRDCPAEWRLDCRPSQVSQILLNLLSNSFDAVVDGAERWVRLECCDAGGMFHFVVTDSGPGIPEEVRTKIMNPFFTTKPPGVGVGLGLSISAHIAVSHGGSLRLDDTTPNTRFILELPKQQIQPKVAA
jgi:signal transduction histidine kinase